MDPEVAEAIPNLVEAGLLTPEQAAPLLREARGDRLSVRAELRALLYFAVLLILAGVSILVKENLEQIGPLAIVVAIGLAALAALAWVVHRAAPFAWEEGAPTHLAFDYVLLLGLLLAAADLAYLEVKVSPLGEHWPWHLLIVGLGFGAAAVRWDSRTVAALALSTLAAWRGVSVAGLADHTFGSARAGALRWNAIGCGLLAVGLGWLLVRYRRKAHFEPVAVHFGWLLVLGGLTEGALESFGGGIVWALALGAVGVGLALWAFRRRRFALFAGGAFAAYIAACRIALDAVHDLTFGCFWFAFSGLGMVLLLWRVHRALGGTDED